MAELEGVTDDEIDEMWLAVRAGDGSVAVYVSTREDFTSLNVRGEDRTAVEGVFAQENEWITRQLAKATAQAPAMAVEGARESNQTGPRASETKSPNLDAPVSVSSPTPWHSNPWAVTIVGGVVVVLVAAGLLALLGVSP